jgi:hypothetical protein
MLFPMRRTYLLFSIIVFSAAGLIAQDDAQFQTWMKAAAGANGRARAAITAKDNAAVATEAKTMAGSFDDIAQFWTKRHKDDAVKFAETARDAAKTLEAATTPEEQTAALQAMGATCKGCHAVYREGNKIKQ